MDNYALMVETIFKMDKIIKWQRIFIFALMFFIGIGCYFINRDWNMILEQLEECTMKLGNKI